MLEPRKCLNPKSSRRLALAAIPVAGLLFFGSTASSQAFTPEVAKQIDHFVECFGWMITAPAMHSANCSPPNHVWPRDPDTGSGDGGKSRVDAPSGPDEGGGDDDGNEDGGDEGGVIV